MRIRVPSIGNLVLLGASLLFTLACAEVFLRLAKPQIFDVHPPGMYVEDAEVGYLLKPGFSGVIERSEFHSPFSVNAQGLRGAEPLGEDEDGFTILVLGDSQAFGFGVLDDETFSRQLEVTLSETHPDLNARVLNAGIPGYGTADQLAFLKTKGAALNPDLVIVQFLSVNDIVESRWPASSWAVVEGDWLGHRQSDTGSGAEEQVLNLGERIQAITKLSHLLHLVSNSFGYLGVRLGLIDRIDGLWGEDFSNEDGERATALLVEIADESRRLGAKPLFLYTTGKNYVLGGDYELPRSGQVVRNGSNIGQAPWIDATPFLRDQSNRSELYFAFDGHWSPQGHRAIADLLADQLPELGLLDPVPEGS